MITIARTYNFCAEIHLVVELRMSVFVKRLHQLLLAVETLITPLWYLSCKTRMSWRSPWLRICKRFNNFLSSFWLPLLSWLDHYWQHVTILQRKLVEYGFGILLSWRSFEFRISLRACVYAQYRASWRMRTGCWTSNLKTSVRTFVRYVVSAY